MWFLLLRQTLIRGGIDKMKGISEKTLIKIKDLKAREKKCINFRSDQKYNMIKI